MDLFLSYVLIGFRHVLPLGADHILFILAIFFSDKKISYVILLCTVFTLAHSIALALTAAGIWLNNSHITEPLIAFSIVVTGIGNIVNPTYKSWRIIVIGLFGLIHGMGFATALMETGLPKTDFIFAIVSFNIGVELGQITIIVICWLLLSKWFSDKPWYHNRIVYPASSLIACMAMYWTIERLM